jgi:hypothetical protein
MKNFLAVVAGLAFTIAISLALDSAMRRSGVFSDAGMTTGNWQLAFSYRLLTAIGGGWITARLAQSRPLFFAVILGVIGTVIALAGLLAVWMAGPDLGPLWYPSLLVITAVPCTWLGGKLAQRPRA